MTLVVEKIYFIAESEELPFDHSENGNPGEAIK